MKLEVGMYARTLSGIQQFKKENDNGWFFDKGMIIKPDNLEKYIIKSRPDIIDLIEVGDYVNGYKVIDINIELDEVVVVCLSEYDGVEQPVKKHIKEEDIKSIVTKEQFESMSYKVGD